MPLKPDPDVVRQDSMPPGRDISDVARPYYGLNLPALGGGAVQAPADNPAPAKEEE